jgi:hypothetical protein
MITVKQLSQPPLYAVFSKVGGLIFSKKEIPALVEGSEKRQKNIEAIPDCELTSAGGRAEKRDEGADEIKIRIRRR